MECGGLIIHKIALLSILNMLMALFLLGTHYFGVYSTAGYLKEVHI